MGVMCVPEEGGVKMPRELSYNDYVRRLSMEATRWLYVNELTAFLRGYIETAWKELHDDLLLNGQLFLSDADYPEVESTGTHCYLDNRYGGGGYFLMGGKKHSFKDLFWIKLHD